MDDAKPSALGRRCTACGGSRTLRLPIHTTASAAVYRKDVAIEPLQIYEVPCPVCNKDTAPAERVAFCHATETVHSEYASNKHYVESRKRDIAYALASVMLRDGFISFSEGPSASSSAYVQPGSIELRGVIGVVSASYVKSTQDRINERVRRVVAEVIKCAVYSIRGARSTFQYGPALTGNGQRPCIPTGEAVRLVESASSAVDHLIQRDGETK